MVGFHSFFSEKNMAGVNQNSTVSGCKTHRAEGR